MDAPGKEEEHHHLREAAGGVLQEEVAENHRQAGEAGDGDVKHLVEDVIAAQDSQDEEHAGNARHDAVRQVDHGATRHAPQVKLVDAGHLEDGGFHQDVQRGVACVPEGVGIEFFRIDEGFPLSRQNGFLFADLGVGKKGVEAGAGAPADHLDGSQPVGGHPLSPGHVPGDLGLVHGGAGGQSVKIEKVLHTRNRQQQDEDDNKRCAGCRGGRIHEG